MLYTYGLRLGVRSLLRGHITKKTAALLIMPVNYWRIVEYSLAFRELQPKSDDVILDIGSPKLFSLYLAERFGLEIHPTDIEDYFIKEYEFHKSLLPAQAQSNVHPSVQDGRKLNLADNTFTKVYSISVIEHIPDNGDSQCVQEIARVLRPDGHCVITIPFAPEGYEEYTNDDFYWAGSSKKGEGKKVFFQRRYSERDIHERLVKPSGMKLSKLEYVGENILTESKKEFSSLLPFALGPFHPMFAKMFLTKPTTDYHQLKKPLCALVVLHK